MGMKLLSALDSDTKPNYVTSTVAAGSMSIVDGQFASFIGSTVSTNVESFAGLETCKDKLRENGWGNPGTGTFNSVIFNTKTQAVTIALDAILPVLTEDDVAIIQGFDYTGPSDSNSPHAVRMAELYLENSKAA